MTLQHPNLCIAICLSLVKYAICSPSQSNHPRGSGGVEPCIEQLGVRTRVFVDQVMAKKARAKLITRGTDGGGISLMASVSLA